MQGIIAAGIEEGREQERVEEENENVLLNDNYSSKEIKQNKGADITKEYSTMHQTLLSQSNTWLVVLVFIYNRVHF